MASTQLSLGDGFDLQFKPDNEYELLAGIIKAEIDPNQPQSSPPSVSEQNQVDSNDASGVQVIIKQKPRGSKGVWLPLSAGDRVRVSDKKAGKNLRLVFASSRHDLDLEHVQFQCYEKTTALTKKKPSDWQPSPVADYIELKRKRLDPEGANIVDMLEVEVKLLVMYRLVKFLVLIPFKNPTIAPVSFESIEFITYNSGSEDTKKKKRAQGKTKVESPDEEDIKMEVVEDPSCLPSPPVEPANEDALSPIPFGTQSPSDHQSPSTSSGERNTREYDQFSASEYEFEEDWSVMHEHLSVDGVMRARRFLQFSDVRLKTDIQDICSAMDIVSSLNGRSYRWKSRDRTSAISSSASTSTDDSSRQRGEKTLGFIAQELQRVVPEVVRETSSGFLSVAYAELIPILIEAFKYHMQRQREAELSAKELNKQAENFARLKQAFSNQAKAASERLSQLESRKPSRSARSRRDSSSSKSSFQSSSAASTSVEMRTLNSKHSRRRSIWSLDGDGHEKKRRSSHNRKCCSRENCSAPKVIGGILIFLLFGAAIALGVTFGLKPSLFSPASQNDSNRSPSAVSATPVSFSTTNYYVSDPGFEDPTAQLWGGNHTFYQYDSGSKRGILASRFPRVDNASSFFDAGRYAVYIYQSPSIAELPQFPAVGLQQLFDFPSVVERLRARQNRPGDTPTGTNANSTVAAAPSVEAPSSWAMESLFLNITVWMNREYANNPSIRDASWIPQDVWIGIRLFYNVSGSAPRETIIKQPLSPTFPRGWQHSWMAAMIPIPSNLPLPSRASITFFSTMPGYIFFDKVDIDSRIV